MQTIQARKKNQYIKKLLNCHIFYRTLKIKRLNMGQVINAKALFRARARELQDYQVNCVANVQDYMFLKLAKPNSSETIMTVAVPLSKYSDVHFLQGDMVRLRLTSELVGLMSGKTPHRIVSYIEKLGGELFNYDLKQRVVGGVK